MEQQFFRLLHHILYHYAVTTIKKSVGCVWFLIVDIRHCKGSTVYEIAIGWSADFMY